MPRPKVLPANRLRVSEACLPCRASKKRCSGTFPCTKCIRNGRAESCIPFRHASASSARQKSGTPRKSLNSTGPLHSGNQAAATSGTPFANIRPQSLPSDPFLKKGAPHKTPCRMLKNLQGERVYIGRAASLSFLQWLRDTVTQHIGPSQFSHNVKLEDMLETETPHDLAPVFENDLDLDEEQAFIQTYYVATSGFLNVFLDSEATQLLQKPNPESPNANTTMMALRDIMVAIGAQSCKSDPRTIRVEQFFFDRAQRSAFAGMLENPSLELVRLFTLMSFYMLGACRRNAAFMYLGVAARAAAALGLHLNDAPSLAQDEQEKRTRVWMSLCTLDLLVSSILGRPPATANLHSETAIGPVDELLSNSSENADSSLVASYSMSRILDEIVVQLYNDKAASTDVAESLLEKLKQWSNALPESLLTSPGSDSERMAAQEHIIGSLHVACAYHFAVIIVTRPFLISVLGVRLARLHQGSPGVLPDETLLEDPAQARLADACIESALYMIQTCMEVHQSCLLLANMCILKALVFAAALIPGFSMFCQKEVDTTLEEAFNGALEILRVLSQQSAQAAHYYEILSLLRNAIDEQRQRLRENPQPNKKYVSKLFSLSNHLHHTPEFRASSTMVIPAEAEDPVDPAAQSEIIGSYPEMTTTDNPALFFDSLDIDPASVSGWEGMELPLWDRFPFIDESSL